MLKIQLVGLHGIAAAGKDTIAAHLCARHGFRQLAFAEPVKELACHLLGWEPVWWGNRAWREEPQEGLGEISPRQFVQRLGNGMRELSPRIWIDALFGRLAALEVSATAQSQTVLRVVVSDIRHPNELASLHVWARQHEHAHVHVRTLCILNAPHTLTGEAAGHVSERGISPDLFDAHVAYGKLLTTLQEVDVLARAWGFAS